MCGCVHVCVHVCCVGVCCVDVCMCAMAGRDITCRTHLCLKEVESVYARL